MLWPAGTVLPFLLELLESPGHTHFIKWTDVPGEFKLVNKEEVGLGSSEVYLKQSCRAPAHGGL